MKLLSQPEHGAMIDARETMYPCLLTVMREEGIIGESMSTLYGYVAEGDASIETMDFTVRLKRGGFFAVPGKAFITTRGMVAVIQRFGFTGQFAAGIREGRGRLSYIDGCSDSILVYPPRFGDPVLNHLHFPRGILQTQHTHPSIRLGIVADGRGEAWQQETNTSKGWSKPLIEGSVFLLEEQELHSFRTDESAMDVIAFHPDSDWGPTDSGHPMIQRTYIDHGK